MVIWTFFTLFYWIISYLMLGGESWWTIFLMFHILNDPFTWNVSLISWQGKFFPHPKIWLLLIHVHPPFIFYLCHKITSHSLHSFFLSCISDMNSLNMVSLNMNVWCCWGILINKDADKTTANDYNQWCSSHHGSCGGAAFDEYRHLLIGTLRYAINKLNQKAIYANMVAFSSKVLGTCPLFTSMHWNMTDVHYFSHVFLQDPVRCCNSTTSTTC